MRQLVGVFLVLAAVSGLMGCSDRHEEIPSTGGDACVPPAGKIDCD